LLVSIDSLLKSRWSIELLLNSHGAMAVILLCLADRDIARPRNVLVGNLADGVIGVACRLWVVPHSVGMAIVLAVSVTIFVMTLLECPYPPGGAIALWAVMAIEPFDALTFIGLSVLGAAAIYLSIVHLMQRMLRSCRTHLDP
jgi:CBS-domain-containing membrane protein